MKVVTTALTLATWCVIVAALEIVLVPHRVIQRALGGGR